MPIYYKASNKLEKLIPGNTYHIFNKAIGNDKLFVTEKDYFFFLQKLNRFILPIADLISYCLIPNHFHLLVEIKEPDKLPITFSTQKEKTSEQCINQEFSNFFNSYTRSFNKAHKRAGRLFLYPFKRICIEDDESMLCLINYIHRNPIHHGITKSYMGWKYSSFQAIISNKPTKVNRELALSHFDSKIDFITFHEENKTKPGMNNYLFE